jgi:hypothetical protein
MTVADMYILLAECVVVFICGSLPVDRLFNPDGLIIVRPADDPMVLWGQLQEAARRVEEERRRREEAERKRREEDDRRHTEQEAKRKVDEEAAKRLAEGVRQPDDGGGGGGGCSGRGGDDDDDEEEEEDNDDDVGRGRTAWRSAR